MARERPVVIVGAGLSGAASALALAARGVPVTVVEQFAAGHEQGSSHGSARIVRRAYGDAMYTSLTGRTFELWRAVEDVSGTPLLRMLGGLDFGPARDVPTLARHLTDAGVPHEVLPAAEAMRRWPGMVFEGDVVFHPQAGTVDAELAVTQMLALATRSGAVVRHETAAVDVRDHRVQLAGGEILDAQCVVVAAGAWAAPLLARVGAGWPVPLPPLQVTQQQIFHFRRLAPSDPPWPSVIHEDVRAMYHLAGGRDGGPGDDRKVAEHDGGVPTTAAAARAVDPSSRQRVVAYVQRWLPGLDPAPRNEATCLYTETPSEDFVLDRAGDVVVCSPCSGHGAKFAPLIGELVADLVTGADAGVAGGVPDRFRLAWHARAQAASVSL